MRSYNGDMDRYTRNAIIIKENVIYIEIPTFLPEAHKQSFITNIKNYIETDKYPVIDMKLHEYPSLYTLEIILRIYNSFINIKPIVLINASKNLKRMIKNNHLNDLFDFCEDETEAIDYYNNYLLKTIWK